MVILTKEDEFLEDEGNFYFSHINVEVPFNCEMERYYLEAASYDTSIKLIERIESITEVIDRSDLETVFPSYLVTRPYKKEIVVFLQNARITKKMVRAMDEISAYAKSFGGEVIFIRPQDCSFEDEDSFRTSYTNESEANN